MSSFDGMVANDPEMLLDVLSIKCFKERQLESGGASHHCPIQRLDDFENFVQGFPIDDSISECFASSSEETVRNLCGAVSEDCSKSGKKEKPKKKKHQQRVDSGDWLKLGVAGDIGKQLAGGRSKGGPNFFRRRVRPWALPKKLFSSDDKSETGLTASTISNACQEIAESYSLTRGGIQNESPRRRHALKREFSIGAGDCQVALNSSSLPERGLRTEPHKDDGKLSLTQPGTASVGGVSSPSSGLLSKLKNCINEGAHSSRLLPSSSICRECEKWRDGGEENTPAHEAANLGHMQCLQALLEHASSLTSPNRLGHSPLYFAERTKHSECHSYLSLVELCHTLLLEMSSYAQIIKRLQTHLDSVDRLVKQLHQLLLEKTGDLGAHLGNLTETINEAWTSKGNSSSPVTQKSQKRLESSVQKIKASVGAVNNVKHSLEELTGSCRGLGNGGLVLALGNKLQELERDLKSGFNVRILKELGDACKRNRVISCFILSMKCGHGDGAQEAKKTGKPKRRDVAELGRIQQQFLPQNKRQPNIADRSVPPAVERARKRPHLLAPRTRQRQTTSLGNSAESRDSENSSEWESDLGSRESSEETCGKREQNKPQQKDFVDLHENVFGDPIDVYLRDKEPELSSKFLRNQRLLYHFEHLQKAGKRRNGLTERVVIASNEQFVGKDGKCERGWNGVTGESLSALMTLVSVNDEDSKKAALQNGECIDCNCRKELRSTDLTTDFLQMSSDNDNATNYVCTKSRIVEDVPEQRPWYEISDDDEDDDDDDTTSSCVSLNDGGQM